MVSKMFEPTNFDFLGYKMSIFKEYGAFNPTGSNYRSLEQIPMILKMFEPLKFFITKTYLYNFDPLKPHVYIVKLGFIGVYIIFLISAQKHRLWVFVRTASPGWF